MYFLLTELTTCENPHILRVLLLIKNIFNIFSVLLPIILIILIIIDLMKMVISGNDDKGKSFKPIMNRIILSIAIFFVPTIVNLIMININNLGLNSSENYSNCFVNANKESIEIYQTQFDAIEKEEDERRKQEFKDLMEQNKDNFNDGHFSGTSGGSGDNDSQDDENNNENEDSDEQGGTESSGNLYTSLASKMIQIAQNELGTSEGNNNENKYGAELEINNEPWCAIFVTWVAKKTNINGTNLFDDVIQKESKIRYPYSAVNSIYNFQQNKNLNFYLSKFHGNTNYTPKKGDYIYFNWNGTWDGTIHPDMRKEGDHVGIVEYVSGETVYTIEGNANGGQVARMSYNLNSKAIMGYGSWYK